MKGKLPALAGSTLFAVAFVFAAPTTPDIDLKIQVSVPKKPVATGAEGEAVVTLTAPSGVHLNRYPPIRLTLEKSPPLVFPQTEIKVGLEKMPEDIETNPFEKVDPIRVRFHVGNHDGDANVPVKGKLRFYYCVKKSGYCAPGHKDIAFNIPISAR